MLMTYINKLNRIKYLAIKFIKLALLSLNYSNKKIFYD